MRRNFSGFTLIELILVMVIVAVLSVIGVGSYTQAIVKSRDSQRKNDLNQIAKAIELFNSDLGRYPRAVDGVMQCPKAPAGTEFDCGMSISAFVNGETTVYMDNFPKDTKNERKYVYESNESGNSFGLYAALENEEDTLDWGIFCGKIKCNYKITETGLVRTK